MTADASLSYRFKADEQTIPHMLRTQAQRLGRAPLFECAGERWSYDETVGIAARMAGRLQKAGVLMGDRVAILSRNRPELMRVLLGAAWCGAIAVPINAGARGPQVKHALGDSRARLLVVEAELLVKLGVCD